jgi:hypothetical protein
MLVLHANWTRGALRLWGESLDAFHRTQANRSESTAGVVAVATAPVTVHPFALNAQELLVTLERFGLREQLNPTEPEVIRLRLPRDDQGPWPSERLGRAAGTVDQPIDPWLGEFDIPCVAIPPQLVPMAMGSLERNDRNKFGVELSQSVAYWSEVVRFVLDQLADQRFVPVLLQESAGTLLARWLPWLHDEQAQARVSGLLAMMPPVVRASPMAARLIRVGQSSMKRCE